MKKTASRSKKGQALVGREYENIHISAPAPQREIIHNNIRHANCEINHISSPPLSASAAAQAPLRLNRYIASAGICSRRKADDLILQGKVSVNGQTVSDLGARVLPGDHVQVEGRVLCAAQPLTYIAMYKPVKTVCTVSDPEGRRTVLDLLPPELGRLRLFPVGRLDYFSEGLLLLTNDGELANRLLHPRYEHERTYEVLIRGEVSRAALEDMRTGMQLEQSVRLLPVKAQAQKVGAGNTLLTLVLKQGLNRQIRRMARKWNLTILRLKRVRLGNLELGSLNPGQVRHLTRKELEGLAKMAG